MVGEIEASRHYNLIRNDELIVHEVVRLRFMLAVEGNRILWYQVSCNFLPSVDFVRPEMSGLPLSLDLIHFADRHRGPPKAGLGRWLPTARRGSVRRTEQGTQRKAGCGRPRLRRRFPS